MTDDKSTKISKSDAEWQKELTPEQYHVCRCHGTEPPFSGKYATTKEAGTYACACCGQDLFDSTHKYDSGSGWPSYWQPIAAHHVTEKKDTSHGMVRVEILCSQCEAHLGHVFPDGPKPTGLRYCINSVALNLKKRD